MAKSVNKIAYLDGIRGVAAFLVFFHHYLLAFYSAYFTFDLNATNLHGLDVKYGQSVLSVFSNGNFCVHIFFVLSGLVLSRKYYRSNQFEVVVSGVQRRFLRLYIPVATTMIIAYIMMVSKLFYNMQVCQLTHSEWWLGGLWNFSNPFGRLLTCLKVSTMFQGDSAFDTSLWTMSIELTGSFFVFAFLAFTHNTKNRFFSLVLAFLFCKFTQNAVLSTFVLGISLNYIEDLVPRFNKYLITLFAGLLLAVALLLGSFPSNDIIQGTVFQHFPGLIMRFAPWFHVFGAYFLVMAFVISAPLQKLISLRLFRFLGYISFSLYLLHPLIIGSFSCILFLKWRISMGYNHAVLLIFFLSAVLCILVSWLMTKYIDDQGIRFTKYVYNRWIKKTDPSKDIPGATGS